MGGIQLNGLSSHNKQMGYGMLLGDHNHTERQGVDPLFWVESSLAKIFRNTGDFQQT